MDVDEHVGDMQAMRAFLLGGMWASVTEQLRAFADGVLTEPWSVEPVERPDSAPDRLMISLASGLKFIVKIEEVHGP